jgi:hypothetical protein
MGEVRMNARTVTSAIVVGFWWASALAQAQQEQPAPGIQPPPIRQDATGETLPPPSPLTPDMVPPGMVPPGMVPSGAPISSVSGLSDWILYRRPDCCSAGPLRPLYTEAYLRVGPSIPVGGNFLSRECLVGWTLEGGFRGLCFDPAMTSAWTIDVGIVNSNNGALSPGTPVPLEINEPNAVGTVTSTKLKATVKNYNRTFFNLGFGKEWYPLAPANSPGGTWRFGVDGGGRYGSASMTFNEIRHRTHTIYGTYAAIHTDYEIPCGCCYIAFGLRCEWCYTWSGILQKQSNLEDINTLVTFSVRY